MMKIVFFSHEYPPSGGGGATALKAIGEGLQKRGHSVTVVTIGVTEHPIATEDTSFQVLSLEAKRISLLNPKKSELIRSYCVLRKEAPRIFDELKPDLACGFFAFPAGHAIARAAVARKIPLVLSLRGSDVPGFSSQRWGAFSVIQTRLFHQAMSQATACWANGHLLQSLAEKKGDWSVVNIPNGIAPVSKEEKTVRDVGSPLKLLFVGQLIPRKGIVQLVEALELFASSASPVRVEVTLIGEGHLKPMLTERLQCIAETDSLVVRLVGHVSREKVCEYYQSHDVLMMLSSAEGVSNVLLEGMSYGLALLATIESVDASLELSSEDYVSVAPEPKAIFKAIRSLCEDEGKVLALQTASRACGERWCWEKQVASIESLFESVLH